MFSYKIRTFVGHFGLYNMKREQIKNTDLNVAKKKLSFDEFIENDIMVLDDMRKMVKLNEPRRMTFILVGLCLDGQATYTVDTQGFVINKGDVLIVTDRHVVDNCTVSEDMKGLCMMISVKFFYEVVSSVSEVSSLLLFAMNNPVVSLTEHEAETFTRYFYLVKDKIADTSNLFRRDVVRTLMLAMFYDLGNVISRDNNVASYRQTRADDIFMKFIKLVEENYKRERHVGWYAGQLCISPKYLSEMIKQVSKRTPNEWIDSYVVLELRIQLRNSAKTIKEIANELDFPNQSFLGKYFKEHMGISPSSYRRNVN